MNHILFVTNIENFRNKLEMFKARSGPHWKLALQGQIHYLTEEDFQIVEEELKRKGPS